MMYFLSFFEYASNCSFFFFFFFNDTATTEIYTLSLHDALPISRVRIRARDLAPGQDIGFAIEIHDFVARAHERDPWRAIHDRQFVGQRREHAELRRAEYGARREREGALRDVLAAAPQVLAGVAHVADRDSRLGEGLGVFLPDHAVRSLGERRAREDARRLPGADGLAGEVAGRHRLDDLQLDWSGDVDTPYRVAVHRRVVPRRQVEGARHLLGEHGVERLAQRPAHGLERVHMLEDETGGVGGRHGGRILARSQARLA